MQTKCMLNYHQSVSISTSMTAEDLLVHYGSDGQAVEAVGERLPQLYVESAFTCKINKAVSQEALWRGPLSKMFIQALG